jgi:predicted kinase
MKSFAVLMDDHTRWEGQAESPMAASTKAEEETGKRAVYFVTPSFISPTFTMLVGLPRSGKSTWVNRCCKNPNDIVISNDWIREHILGVAYCEASNAIVWTIIDATMRICLSQGKNVILDGVNHHPGIRKYYLEIARKYNANIIMIVFDTPLEVCLKREFKVPAEVIHRMYDEFKMPTPDEYDQIIHVTAQQNETA